MRRHETAAEYAAMQAVLKIIAEHYQEKLQRVEAEDKLIVADREAAALIHGLQRETARRKCCKVKILKT